MEEALRGIAQAFARNRENTTSVEVALLVLLGVVLMLQLARLGRRLVARATRLRRLAADLGLGGEALALVRTLAQGEGSTPELVLTHLDVFERATARALADAGPGAEGRAEAIGRLRHLTGFDRLPAHTPLLSTRELSPGTALTLGELPGQLDHVDERTLGLELPTPPALATGAEARLGLAHSREARYALRCTVVASGPGAAGGWHLTLAHDEAPQRIQQRGYARVALLGPLVLRPAVARPAWPAGRTELRARLVDVSGGGALVTTRAGLPVGLLTRASFAVGDVLFSDLRAVVLASERAPPDGWRLHLEFSRLSDTERARLVSSVERLEVFQAHRLASG